MFDESAEPVRPNPHHANSEWALDPDCAWGVARNLPEVLREAVGSDDLEFGPVEVGPVERLPEGGAVIRRLRLDLLRPSDESSARLLIDVPYVAPSGAIIGRTRDVAPVAFLRLAPGTYRVGSGDEMPLDAAEQTDLEQSDLEQFELGTTPVETAAATGGPQLIHVAADLRAVTLDLDDRTVFVPGRGLAQAEAIRAALSGTPDSGSPSAPARRIARHLLRIEREDDAFDASAFLDGSLAASSHASAAALMGDLDNCQLLLAGRHLARTIIAAARRSAPGLVDDDESSTTLTLQERSDRLSVLINERIEQLISGARPDPDGGTTPFELLDRTNALARFEQCRKVSRLGPGGVGTMSATSAALRDIHPSQVGRLCPLTTPESDRVGLVRQLTLRAQVDVDGRFEPIDGEPTDLPLGRLLSASALLLPLINHDDAVRSVLAAKSVRQFVPLENPEVPLVGTGFESAVTAALGVSHRAELSGRVTVDGRTMEVFDSNRVHRGSLPLRNHAERAAEAGIDDTRIVCVGGIPARPPIGATWSASMSEGDLLWRDPSTALVDGDAVIAPGVNAVCAVMPFAGANIEDALVVSETLADRMRTLHLETIRERITPDEIAFALWKRLVGREVAEGEELFVVVATDPGPDDDGRSRRSILSSVSGTIIEAGVVVEPTGERLARVIVRVTRPLAPGDKVIARHGNKGVVSRVVPDAEMPEVLDYRGDGRAVRAELLVSPFGPLRRMVVGLFHELAWGRVASATGRTTELPPLRHCGTAALDAALRDAGVTTTATVRLADGRECGGTAVGALYLIKLNHLAERKLQSQGWSPASPMSGQPSRTRLDEMGTRIGRAQRLGEMEFWALQAAGAGAVINDALGTRRGAKRSVAGSLWVVLDHLAAASIHATLEFDDGSEISSLDVPAIAAEQRPLRKLTFDLIERRRLATESTDQAALPPGPIIDFEPGPDEVRRSRAAARAATPRPIDQRQRLRATPPWFDRPDVYPASSEVECRCGTTIGFAPGTVCTTCGRTRRRVRSLTQQHQTAFLDLSTPVVHPWLRDRFWSLVCDIATTDDVLAALLERAIAPDAAVTSLRPTSITPTPEIELGVIDRLRELRADATGPSADEATEALAATIRFLPVLPPAYQQRVRGAEGQSVQDPLTGRYWAVAAAVRSFRDAGVTERRVTAHASLTSAVGQTLGRSTTRYAGERTIAHRLRHKEGLLRRYLLGTSQWATAHAVMIPDSDLELDQVGLPASIMSTLGVAPDGAILINRSPTLLTTGLLGARAVPVDGAAVRIPPTMIPMLAGDFDGDTVTVHAPIDPAAASELKEVLHPALSLRSPTTGDDLVHTGEEVAIDDDIQAEITEAARAAHQHALGDRDGLAAATAHLRDLYVRAYDRLTGSTSVDLLGLRDETDAPWMSAVRRGGLKASQLAQIRERVGTAATYASRMLGDAPVVIDGCFLDGLGTAEVIANARAAMPKLGDKKLSTPAAGDFTKVLVESLYDVEVRAGDCGTTETIPLDQLSRRAKRRVGPGTGATTVRSPLCCDWLREDPSVVCAACYGDDVATGRPVAAGRRVGISAAQGIGERGTQLALKSIHSGADRTDLDRVIEPLRSVRPVDVPIPRDGGLVDRAATSSLAESPLSIVQLLRWVYTFDRDGDTSDEITARALPAVDDIHLELAVASIASAQRRNGGPRAGSGISAALAVQDPLALSTVRGSVVPLIAAAADRRSTGGRKRTTFLLSPRDLTTIQTGRPV